MSERIRALFTQVREYVGNRRRSTRYDVRLPITVHVRAAPHRIGAARVPPVSGFTQDISKSGLALIMPAIRAGTVYLTREDAVLRVIIELPDGSTLELDAVPVRYHQLDSDSPNVRQYLIGVRITGISDAERTRLTAFLASLK